MKLLISPTELAVIVSAATLVVTYSVSLTITVLVMARRGRKRGGRNR